MNPSSIGLRRAEVGMFAKRQSLQFITVINVTAYSAETGQSFQRKLDT